MIEIKVRDKVATRTDDAQLVCSNSYTVHFTFDSEWAGQSTKTMRVQNGATYADVTFTGDTVALPVYDSARVLSIGVYAGNLTTTTPAFLRMQESIRSRGGSQSAPTPSVYDQLVAAINARANVLDYDDGTLSLKAGTTVLSEVEVSEFGFATEAYVDAHHDSTKQDVISDLATIRSGAALGATAIQEHQSLAAYRTAAAQDVIDASKADAADIPTKTSDLTNDSGFLTQHQSLDNYSTTAQMNAAINAHHDSTKQDVISDLATIRSGAALGATAIQSHQSLAAYRTSAAQDVIDNAIAADVDAIEAKIPAQATEQNQLADRSFVNSSINSVTAYYITKTAAGAQFATHAELAAATTFYSGGEVRVPTRNDYCIVQADENHENATTRYIYQNSQWEFQYIVNETALTSDQLAALNSGITSNLVSGYNSHVANTGIHVTSAEKATWNGKQDAIPENTYDAYGAARTAILGHNAAANAHSSLFASKESTANKVTSLSSASTDSQYPSAKCVYDLVGNIEATLQAIRGV